MQHLRAQAAYLERSAAKAQRLHDSGLGVGEARQRLLQSGGRIVWLTAGLLSGENLVRAFLRWSE